MRFARPERKRIALRSIDPAAKRQRRVEPAGWLALGPATRRPHPPAALGVESGHLPCVGPGADAARPDVTLPGWRGTPTRFLSESR